MNKRMLLALGLALAGCAGSNEEAREDDEEEVHHHQAKQQKRKHRAQPQPTAEDEEEEVADGAPAAAPPPVRMHGPKKRIGIVDFDDASRHSYWGGSRNALAESARDAATELLVKSGAFVVVEREQIAAVLREQGLGMTGAISPQSAAKAGKLLGLQALVTGKITDFDVAEKRSGFGGYYQSRQRTYHARVSLRIVDATTGEIWLAESGVGSSEQKDSTVMGGGSTNEDQTLGKRALYGAINQMIAKVLSKADAKPWAGAVAKVGKGGKIYITAGSDIGLPVGATLSVRRLGDEITDPSTGAVIGHEMGNNVGKLQVAEHMNEKLSVCVAVKGGGFASGDVVTLDAVAGAAQPAPATQRRKMMAARAEE
jgi:curli biogenesis system outer membrane secretion channel CsgG